MSDINTLVVSGTVESDPVPGQTTSGLEMCHFTLVSVDEYKEKRKEEFIKCVAWGDSAKAAAALVQGDVVVVQGRLSGRRSEKTGYVMNEVTVSRIMVPFKLGSDTPF